MSKRIWIVIVVALSMILALSACQRSASKPPVATATKSGGLPFPTPIPNDSLKAAQAGTQTAQALSKPTTELVAGATEPATGATETPVPAIGGGENTPTAVLPTAVVVQPQPSATQPAVVVVVPSATPGRPATYTLQNGEFPFCIARRFNSDVATLLALNGLNTNSKPSVGFVLNIPQTGVWSNGARALIAHPGIYTVKAGDTIYKIACAYGDVDPNAMIVANSLKSPYTLTAGQVLQIP
jgi:LysM repeat protein